MVLLDKLWDDVVAGPSPDTGLGMLRKISSSKPIPIIVKGDADNKVFQKSSSMPASPVTPVTPTTPTRKPDNVWRSVFHPGSNLATKGLGAALFDKPQSPSSPTVYDWLYSGETRSKHQ